jgi:hypothetical protein
MALVKLIGIYESIKMNLTAKAESTLIQHPTFEHPTFEYPAFEYPTLSVWIHVFLGKSMVFSMRMILLVFLLKK